MDIKKHNAAELFPSLFRNGGEMHTSEVTKLMVLTWARKKIRKDWKKLIVTFHRKDNKSPSENHKEISLVSIAYSCSQALSSTDYLTLEKDVPVRMKLFSGQVGTLFTKYKICEKFMNISTRSACRLLPSFFGPKVTFDSTIVQFSGTTSR